MDSVNYSGVQIKKNKSWTIHHTSHISLITIYYLSPVIYHHISLAKTIYIFKTEENTQATTSNHYFIIRIIYNLTFAIYSVVTRGDSLSNAQFPLKYYGDSCDDSWWLVWWPVIWCFAQLPISFKTFLPKSIY